MESDKRITLAIGFLAGLLAVVTFIPEFAKNQSLGWLVAPAIVLGSFMGLFLFLSIIANISLLDSRTPLKNRFQELANYAYDFGAISGGIFFIILTFGSRSIWDFWVKTILANLWIFAVSVILFLVVKMVGAKEKKNNFKSEGPQKDIFSSSIQGFKKTESWIRTDGEPPNEQVKKLFYALWKNFPNGLIQKKINETIVKGDVRDHLVKHGFLYKEEFVWNGKKVEYFGLGANGLSLISAWETETLTRSAVGIAVVALLVSIVLLVISL